tara:strand:+ start:7719 stop:8687 length:969 start_codon:yes stop_codon:yes gene_type:complete
MKSRKNLNSEEIKIKKSIIKRILIRLINIILYRFRKLRRKITYYNINVFPHIYRPSSRPFISGDSYRKMANHIFDETTGFKPEDVKEGDVIFLKSDLIDIFFNYFHGQINKRYVLITHNSDGIIEDKHRKLFDNKIIHWFTQNLNFPMDKNFSILPIGLENKRYLNNGLLSHFKRYQNEEKTSLILSSFNEGTNKERSVVQEIINKNKLVTNKKFPNHKTYVKHMSTFKYNICPPGNGLDTHRFWESLMVNTIPIVLKTKFTSNLEKLGIPALYVDKWSDLNNFNEEELTNIYKEIIEKNNLKKFLFYNFWEDLISKQSTNV